MAPRILGLITCTAALQAPLSRPPRAAGRAVKSALLSDYVLDLEKRCSGGTATPATPSRSSTAFAKSLEQKRARRAKAAELLRAAGPPSVATAPARRRRPRPPRTRAHADRTPSKPRSSGSSTLTTRRKQRGRARRVHEPLGQRAHAAVCPGATSRARSGPGRRGSARGRAADHARLQQEGRPHDAARVRRAARRNTASASRGLPQSRPSPRSHEHAAARLFQGRAERNMRFPSFPASRRRRLVAVGLPHQPPSTPGPSWRFKRLCFALCGSNWQHGRPGRARKDLGRRRQRRVVDAPLLPGHEVVQ